MSFPVQGERFHGNHLPDLHMYGSTLRHCCLQVWDLSRGFQVNTFLQPSSVNAVRLTMDGTMAVSGHFDGTLRFWDLRSAKLANEVTGLHTQQITSVSIGIRSGKPDALAHLGVRTASTWRAGAAGLPGRSLAK